MSTKHANGKTEVVVEAGDDLAQLVDRVVEGHRPILVARNGEPKAALVSMEDYARIQDETPTEKAKLSMKEWGQQAKKLSEDILAYRGNRPVDLDKLIGEMRDELEERDAHNSGH